MTNDGKWELNSNVERSKIKDAWLSQHKVVGGFTEEVYSMLCKDDSLVREVAEVILHNHFPETIYEDILAAVGLDFDTSTTSLGIPSSENGFWLPTNIVVLFVDSI